MVCTSNTLSQLIIIYQNTQVSKGTSKRHSCVQAASRRKPRKRIAIHDGILLHFMVFIPFVLMSVMSYRSNRQLYKQVNTITARPFFCVLSRQNNNKHIIVIVVSILLCYQISILRSSNKAYQEQILLQTDRWFKENRILHAANE